jgi:hypothetical protein
VKDTAHLVIFIDTQASPPVVASAGVFGEKSPTTNLLSRQACCVLSFTAGSYGEARDWIIQQVATNPHYDWIGKLDDWKKCL